MPTAAIHASVGEAAKFLLRAEMSVARLLKVIHKNGLFRLIQSVPSPKAEPFKQWLAQVGYERMLEIENPELATQRTRELYKAKGYPDDWIERRMRSIAIREELTDEWQQHGVREQKNILKQIFSFIIFQRLLIIQSPKIVISLVRLRHVKTDIVQFLIRNIEVASRTRKSPGLLVERVVV